MSWNCQKCDSDRLIEASGKVSDMFYGYYKGQEINGYVPRDIGLDGGDYMGLTYCLECGQIQGKWPLDEPKIKEKM